MSHIDQNKIERQFSEWLNVLAGLREENIVLKHRLSQIIIARDSSGPDLDVLEAFQNSFLNKDAHISLLLRDIKAQQKLAAALLLEDGTYYAFNHKQQKLEYDLMMMGEQFTRLKTTFEAQFALVG